MDEDNIRYVLQKLNSNGNYVNETGYAYSMEEVMSYAYNHGAMKNPELFKIIKIRLIQEEIITEYKITVDVKVEEI